MKAKYPVVIFLSMLVALSAPLWSAAPLADTVQGLGVSGEVNGACRAELASPLVTPFAVTLESFLEDPGYACAWASAPECRRFIGDCGYEWDGYCCIPRCNGQYCHVTCSV